MKYRLVVFVILVSLSSLLFSQTIQPKFEFRGVWVATVSNIDWPSQPGLKPEQQRQEFIELLDFHEKLGLNAIIVQVRAASDAFYQSDKEPWSYWLTGKQGKAPRPYYDPLEFMIKECHKRKMEFHAWINPFRATINNNTKVHKTHIVNTHPEWIISYAGQKVINPGIPDARKHIVDVIEEIISKYDVDAIHFDDYFYPYPEDGSSFPDQKTFKKHKNGFKEINDWRRNNIDVLIESIHRQINKINPKVKFGISPFGIWRNKMTDSLGSATYGLPSYDAIFADTRKWLEQGWIDYIVPQIYWSQNNKTANYDTLTDWWSNNNFDRHLYIGHAPYKINNDEKDKSWKDHSEIPNQIRRNRALENVKGSVFFSSRVLRSNLGNVSDSIQKSFYRAPALIPLMRWKDSIPPEQPEFLKTKITESGIEISWRKAEKAPDGDLPYAYIIYRFTDKNFSVKNPKTIVAIIDGEKNSFLDTLYKDMNGVEYGVTSMDKFSNESPICLKSRLLAESKIQGVTLYLDKAVVTRECKALADYKPVVVKIKGLPVDVDYSSLRVSTNSPVELISYKQDFYYPEPQIDIVKKKELHDSIQTLVSQLEGIKDSLVVLEKTESFLVGNQNVTNSNIQEVTLDRIKDYAEFFEQKMFELKNRQRSLDRRRNVVNEILSSLKEQYTTIPVDFDEKKSLVEVAIVAKEETEATLQISYETQQAGWKPEYDFRTSEGGGNFELDYYANTWQNTGEDWKNITLKLATLNNSFEKGQKYTKENDLYSLTLKDSAASKKNIEPLRAFKYEPIELYDCPLPVSVGNGDKELKVKIGSKETPNDFIYKVIPSKSLNVIKMARLYDWEKLNLYPGKMNVFHESVFINSFNLSLFEDTISVIIKDEPEIKVRKDSIVQKEKRFPSSLMQRDVEGFTFEVLNKKPQDIRLIIEEPLPRSTDKKLRIKPTPSSKMFFNKASLKFEWDAKLAPMEQRSFKSEYYINYPKKYEINRN